MERLPCLVQQLICEHLSYEDLLNLRLTCKRLREFVDQKPFKKLVLFFKHYGKCYRVFPSDRLVGYANSLRFDDPTVFQSAKFQAMFGRLASLIICQTFTDNFVADLALFSQFDRLEHLELNTMASIVGRLELANLRVAAFYTCKKSTFELDCPQLAALSLGHWARATMLGACDRFNHLQVNSPDCHLADPYHQPYLVDLFSQLPELSTVCFKQIGHLNHFLSAILDGRLLANRLSRVELKHCHYLSEFGQLADRLTMLSERPERKQVRFFVNGELIASQTKLDELRRFIERQFQNNGCPFQFWRPKPALLDEMRRTPIASCLFDIVCEFNMTRTVELDECLIDRLKNVQRLTLLVWSPLDVSLFDRMMVRFNQLEVLDLSSACLRQDQLDRLPDHLPYLKRFSCFVSKERSPVSLHFLGRFKNLMTADFSFVLEKPLLELLFRHCELLKKVGFWNMPSKWRVEILRCGKIQQLFETQKVNQFANLQASIDHFYSNDLFGRMIQSNQQGGRSL